MSSQDTSEFLKQAEMKQKKKKIKRPKQSLDYRINCTKNFNSYLNTTLQTKNNAYSMVHQGGNYISYISCYPIPEEFLITKATRTQIFQSSFIKIIWKYRI